ncbi:MAG: sporulation protein YabP [Hydrogenibacillus sp.]|nr:sporulation protein YabP [Hydrogenibacillus sp.]
MAEKTVRHEIGLVNRKNLAISGIKKVDSFDSERFLLETEEGPLVITGENLHLKNLDVEQGEVAIEGKIDALQYVDGAAKADGAKGFFGKLFR